MININLILTEREFKVIELALKDRANILDEKTRDSKLSNEAINRTYAHLYETEQLQKKLLDILMNQ